MNTQYSVAANAITFWLACKITHAPIHLNRSVYIYICIMCMYSQVCCCCTHPQSKLNNAHIFYVCICVYVVVSGKFLLSNSLWANTKSKANKECIAQRNSNNRGQENTIPSFTKSGFVDIPGNFFSTRTHIQLTLYVYTYVYNIYTWVYVYNSIVKNIYLHIYMSASI